MLDLLVAMMEGKPTRICREDCSAELLRLEDFDVERPIESIDGKNILEAEELREMTQAYMAKLFMCWSFEGRTPSSTIVEQQTCSIINTPDSGLSNPDTSAIDSDYWEDDEHGCASSCTGSFGIEQVTTGNAENCLSNLWISEFEAAESIIGHDSMGQMARQLYSL